MPPLSCAAASTSVFAKLETLTATLSGQVNSTVMALQKQHSGCRGSTQCLPPREEDAAMETKTINLRVSADVADAYESASGEEKRKLEALLSSRLREAVRHRKRGRSLEEIMDEMSRRAQERGLTQEKLDEILNEE
jgi:hypothetical protein